MPEASLELKSLITFLTKTIHWKISGCQTMLTDIKTELNEFILRRSNPA